MDLEIFSRAWCDSELVEARNLGMPQHMVIHSRAAVLVHASKLVEIDVRKCDATHPADKEYILGRIDDVDAFNDALQTALVDQSAGAFAKLASGIFW